ncbi:unnamed protein product [Trifolium pratense]|uniref:Uncharacterized protein n=1 Tax=Trifolium pratense TaxID=57577 RepID=A0ACB0MCV4_TRIPR|nr:unnamed protein product [Trifolium pratense]
MAYVKLAIFAVFLLTAFLIFPMKNANESCPDMGLLCSVFHMPPCGGGDCYCRPLALGLYVGFCTSL